MELRHEDVAPEVDPDSAVTLAHHLQTETFKRHLDAILPDTMSTERFASVCLRQLSLIPELQNCTLASVVGGMMTAATLGLEIGVQGECYLIPYKVKGVMTAQLQIGVWGHMALSWRSGLIADVQIDVVLDGDEFDFQKGTNAFLHHKPREGRELDDVGAITWAYAVVRTLGGGVIFDAFDKAWIERRRNVSQSPDSPAWVNFYAEQSEAKTLKTTLKRCPRSREMARAITLDDQADAGAKQVWDVDPSHMLPSRVSLDPNRQPEPEKGNGGEPAAAEPEPEAHGLTVEETQPTEEGPAPKDEDAPADSGGLGWED